MVDTRVPVVSGNGIFRWVARLGWKQDILLDNDSADRMCKSGRYTNISDVRKWDISLDSKVGNRIASWMAVRPVECTRVVDTRVSVMLGNGIFR